MTDAQGVEVVGLGRLRSTLRSAAIEIGNMNRAAEKSARLVATSGRSRAPRRTGRLASSIQVVAMGQGDAEVGSNLIYAPVIHNGWYAHHIRPNPFLADALDRSEVTIVGYYADDVDHALAHVKGA